MSRRRGDDESRSSAGGSSVDEFEDRVATPPGEEDRASRSSEKAGRRLERSRSRRHEGRHHGKEDKKRKKRSKSERRRKEGRGKRRSADHSDDDDSDTPASSNESSEDRRRRRDRSDRKKSKKASNGDDHRRKSGKRKDRSRDGGDYRKRHRHRRHRHSETDESDNDDGRVERASKSTSSPLSAIQRRNREVAQSILTLLSSHPALATELPILLVRLGGGTSFDLSQMTNAGAQAGLERVLRTLEPFGVARIAAERGGGAWTWKPPDGSTSAGAAGRRHHELILIRVLRSLLDEMGLTMQVVLDFEARIRNGGTKSDEVNRVTGDNAQREGDDGGSALANVDRCATIVLRDFEPRKLAGELAVVAEMLLRGECVSLQGVLDANLRSRLEALLAECGLRHQPIASEAVDEKRSSKTDGTKAQVQLTGYAIPDDSPSVEAMCRAKLGLVLRLCQDTITAFTEASLSSDDDEEDGPAPRTAATARKGPSLPPEVLKAQAARRTVELECAKAGVAPPVSGAGGEGQREEWMLVPGKFDFLGSIKSGQSSSLRNRTFENKRGGDAKDSKLDPAVQAQIQQIMLAHEQARGPSLMEMHQQTKKREAAEQAAAASRGTTKKSSAWKWNRDDDLESGRGVDRNALDRVYGNASSDLKSKFQGGFG